MYTHHTSRTKGILLCLKRSTRKVSSSLKSTMERTTLGSTDRHGCCSSSRYTKHKSTQEVSTHDLNWTTEDTQVSSLQGSSTSPWGEYFHYNWVYKKGEQCLYSVDLQVRSSYNDI